MSSVSILAPASWKVVWCNARCFKPDSKTQRQSMAMAARDAGGSLFCLRNAGLFEKWLAATKQSDYVLLTGWREVKPCIATLMECDVTEQPFKIILQCDTPKELYKARTWVQQYSTLRAHHMPDVHVCSSLEPFPSFFAELVQQISGPCVQLPPGKVDTSEKGSVLSDCKKGYETVAPLQSDEAMEEPVIGFAWQAWTQQGCTWEPTNLSPPVALFFEEPMWKGSVQTQIWDHHHSNLQNNTKWVSVVNTLMTMDQEFIEDALKSAMPDVYEE